MNEVIKTVETVTDANPMIIDDIFGAITILAMIGLICFAYRQWKRDGSDKAFYKDDRLWVCASTIVIVIVLMAVAQPTVSEMTTTTYTGGFTVEYICPDNYISHPHYEITVEGKTYEVKPKTYSNTNFLNSGNGIAETDEYDYFEIIHYNNRFLSYCRTLYLTPETKERLQPKCEVVTVGKKE